MRKKFEELSMNAWPALQTVLYDGWILRFANGITKRANSINPIYPSEKPLEEKIKYCENIYKKEGLRVVFKLIPNLSPVNLDFLLKNRDYSKIDTTSFQLLENISQKQYDFKDVEMKTTLSDSWLQSYMNLAKKDLDRFDDYKSILKQIKGKTCFLTLFSEEKSMGCGLGVVENGHIGIFDIVVSKEKREKGNGTKIVNSIISWGRKNGAEKAYLQVVTDNLPAQSLYKKAGFKELYKYWYRVL